MRYLPPKGTAGLARFCVSGNKRLPLPPARTNATTWCCMLRPSLNDVSASQNCSHCRSNAPARYQSASAFPCAVFPEPVRQQFQLKLARPDRLFGIDSKLWKSRIFAIFIKNRKLVVNAIHLRCLNKARVYKTMHSFPCLRSASCYKKAERRRTVRATRASFPFRRSLRIKPLRASIEARVGRGYGEHREFSHLFILLQQA